MSLLYQSNGAIRKITHIPLQQARQGLMHQNNLSAQTGNKQNTNIYFEHDHDSIVKLERMNLFRLLVLRCQGKMYALLALLLTQKMGGAHKN